MNAVSLVLLLLCIVLLLSVLCCSNGPVAWYQHAAPNFLGHAPCPTAERSGHRLHRLELVLDAQAEASVDVHGALEGVQGRVRMSWQRPVLQDMAPFLLPGWSSHRPQWPCYRRKTH